MKSFLAASRFLHDAFAIFHIEIQRVQSAQRRIKQEIRI